MLSVNCTHPSASKCYSIPSLQKSDHPPSHIQGPLSPIQYIHKVVPSYKTSKPYIKIPLALYLDSKPLILVPK